MHRQDKQRWCAQTNSHILYTATHHHTKQLITMSCLSPTPPSSWIAPTPGVQYAQYVQAHRAAQTAHSTPPPATTHAGSPSTFRPALERVSGHIADGQSQATNCPPAKHDASKSLPPGRNSTVTLIAANPQVRTEHRTGSSHTSFACEAHTSLGPTKGTGNAAHQHPCVALGTSCNQPWFPKPQPQLPPPPALVPTPRMPVTASWVATCP